MLYRELLLKEEEFRVNEQSALLSALLSNPGRGTLSILRRAGLAMTGMEVVGRRSGPGGRVILEMASAIGNTAVASSGDIKVSNCFKPGEIVKLIVNGQLLKCTGTIERSRLNVSVSLTEDVETEEMEMIGNGRVAMVKIVDERGSFEKMKRNLEIILDDNCEGGNRSELMKEMREFIKEIEQSRDIRVASNDNLSELTSKLSLSQETSEMSTTVNLNSEQELAVKEALNLLNDPSGNLLLIHGPPGTGKTSTLIEIIRRIRQERPKMKILICGPSNLSVDNIVEGLITKVEGMKNCEKLLRVGHPSRVLESCQGSTLDFWSENSDAGRLLRDVQREIDEIVKNGLSRCKSREERRELYGELKLLRQERRKRGKSLEIELLKQADVVVCTLSTGSGKKLSGMKFDLAILDEAGQSLLPESLIAGILAEKLIMAGDHCQLPPTVMNPGIKERLEVSLFELLIKNPKSSRRVMLKEQYRMNELIMKWSNSEFYSNNLRAHESVKNWTLEAAEKMDVLVFYDTCGFDLWESEEDDSKRSKGILIEEMSKFNEGEAEIVMRHYKKLVDFGVKPENIAIISPYSAQVSLLRDLMSASASSSSAAAKESDVEINSIDAFQGREKDAVIISMVRSNPDGGVGFLGEMRRINVAMTRAKKQLVIVGDSGTLSRDEKLKGLVKKNVMSTCTF